MANIVNEKVGNFSLSEALALGAIKGAEEKALTPLIGNGTLKSGAIKGISAYLISKLWKGSTARMVLSPMIIDATEDILNAMLFGSNAIIQLPFIGNASANPAMSYDAI